MSHETKASRLPGDDPTLKASRDYSGSSAVEIRGNDSLLRLHKPQGLKTTAKELVGGPDTEMREYTIERDSNRPLRFQGHLVGFNRVDPETERGTAVAVFVTRRGKIVTSVHQWQKDAKRERQRHAGAAHDIAEDALAWLIEDGGGHLGRASREAWELACRVWPALEGHEVEVIE